MLQQYTGIVEVPVVLPLFVHGGMRTVFCTQYSALPLKHLSHTAVSQLNHRLDLTVR